MDNWQHRSANMKCGTCMWWMPKGRSTLGRCRRHAPTSSGFPATFDSDFCGDHKLDEGKVDQMSRAEDPQSSMKESGMAGAR